MLLVVSTVRPGSRLLITKLAPTTRVFGWATAGAGGAARVSAPSAAARIATWRQVGGTTLMRVPSRRSRGRGRGPILPGRPRGPSPHDGVEGQAHGRLGGDQPLLQVV